MYVIKMNDDKSLVTTIRGNIYQKENRADTLMFLVPSVYENTDFSNCVMLLRYIREDGKGKSEELQMLPEKYKDFYQYSLKADTEFTAVAGKTELWLTAVNLSDSVVLKSDTTVVRINPAKDIADYFTGEDLDQLEAMSAEIAMLKETKADNSVVDEKLSIMDVTKIDSKKVLGAEIDDIDVIRDLVNNYAFVHYIREDYSHAPFDYGLVITQCINDKEYNQLGFSFDEGYEGKMVMRDVIMLADGTFNPTSNDWHDSEYSGGGSSSEEGSGDAIYF